MSRPSKTPTIRANIVATVVAELIRQGADADRVLRDHIEAIEDIRNPYQEIPLARYVAFFEAAAEAVGDPLFGARMGVHFQAEEFGPLGVVFLAASSLQSALNRLGFFLQAWQGGTSAELEIGAETAEWIYQIDDPDIRPRRQDAEFSISATCGFIRSLLGPRWAPLEVHFEHSPTPSASAADRRALATIFKAPVLFDQNVNRIVVDRQDLGRQVSRSKQAMAPYLEQHLLDLMHGSGDDESCSIQVTHLIAKRLGRHSLDISSLASELGMSTRTLQRRLADEGTSLRDLIRANRTRIAEPLLNGGATPITTIAHSLGYADPTVFSRAFRSWRGASPRSFRNEARTKK